MDEVPVEIKEKLNKFVSLLKDTNLIFNQIILFGSFAKNKYDENSDIDIALVSPQFSGNPFIDNKMIRKAKFGSGYDIETHTFTEEEFISDNPFIKEIMKNGIILQ